MPFCVMYIDKDGNTVVEELPDCNRRNEAVARLDNFRNLSKDRKVSLTSNKERIAQWLKIVKQESEISPKRGVEG